MGRQPAGKERSCPIMKAHTRYIKKVIFIPGAIRNQGKVLHS